MSPTFDFLAQAEKHLRVCVEGLRPRLLETQGNIEHHLKDDDTAVTAMDMFAESEIAAALRKLDPAIPFSGEETGVDFSKQTFWLVDPIDGTEQFMRGLPFATNMISLIDNGEPVFGAVYNFNFGDYYVAIKGHGATRNGHPIHVSDRKPDRAWVTYSTALGEPGTAGFADKLDGKIHSVRRYGSAGYDYSMVASGALEARIVFNGHGHEWDFAPGTLIVQEAGGRVANIGSDKYDYHNYNHIAAGPATFDTLMRLMTEIDRDAKNAAN